MNKNQNSKRAVESTNQPDCVKASFDTAMDAPDLQEKIGPLSFVFKAHGSIIPGKLDTSKRYFHVGGAMKLWRTNRVWHNSEKKSVRHVHYAKGRFTYANKSVRNPQVSNGPGVKLPSNPLPPFVPNDRVKPRQGKEEKDRTLEHINFLRDDKVDAYVEQFVYDAFLTDDQNHELVREFRQRIGLDVPAPPVNTPVEIRTCEWEAQAGLDEYQSAESNEEIRGYMRVLLDCVADYKVTRSDRELLVLADMYADASEIQRLEWVRMWQMVFHANLPDLFEQRRVELARCAKVAPKVVPVEVHPSADTDSESDTTLFNLHRKVGRAVGDFSKFSRKARQTIPSINRAAESVQNLVDTTNDSLIELKNSICKAFKGGAIVNSANFAGSVFNLFYDCVHYNSYSFPVLFLKVSTSLTGILQPLFKMWEFAQADLNLVAQSFASGRRSETLLQQLLGNETLFNLGKTCNAFDQVRRGFKTVKEFAEWVFEQLPEGVQQLLDQLFPSAVDFKRRFRVYAEKLAHAVNLVDQRRVVTREGAEWLFSEARYFSTLLSTPEKNKDLFLAFRSMRAQTLRVVAYAEQYEKLTTPRQCPFSIVFHGGTRVGKSVLMAKVAEIMAQVVRHDSNLLYVRQAGTDHWDGFQDDYFAVGFDDWLQDTDYDDVSEFFSLVTKQHYIVPMASLDDPTVGKKGTLCLAKLILAATNLMNKQAVATKINCPEALFARVGMRVHVEKVSDYDPEHYSHLRFKIEHHNGEFSETLSFYPFMKRAVLAYKAHYATQKEIDVSVVPPGQLAELRALYEAQSWGFATSAIVSTAASLAMRLWVKDNFDFREHPQRSMALVLGSGLLLAGAAFYALRRAKVENQLVARKLEILRYLVMGKTVNLVARLTVDRSSDKEALLAATANFLDNLPSDHPDKVCVQEELEKFAAESRTLEQKTRIRPVNIAESRTLEQKTRMRPVVQAEGLPRHSKMNTPFYDQQERLRRDFPGFVDPGEPDVSPLMAQGASDSQAQAQVEILANRIVPVTLQRVDYKVHFAGVTSVVNYVNAIPVDPFRLLLPKHFFFDANGKMLTNTKDIKYQLVFKQSSKLHPVVFDPARLTIFRDRGGQCSIDAVLFDTTTTTLETFRPCLKFFISESDLAKVRDGLEAEMVGYSLMDGQPTLLRRSFNIALLNRTVSYQSGAGVYSVTSGYTYNAPTMVGECGSAIIVHHPSISGKVIGFHVFGHKLEAFGGALALTRESIERHLGRKEVAVVDPPVVFRTTQRSEEMALKCQNLSIEILGEIDIPVHVSRKTDFVPTPLLDHLPVEYLKVPSEKFSNEGFDPLEVGVMLYGSELYSPDDTHKCDVLRYLSNKYVKRAARVLNAHEAVNSDGGMDRVNLHTSAGFPYVTQGKTKRDFLQVSEQTGVVSYKDPEFELHVDSYIKSWCTTYYDVIWMMSLKDELLAEGKLARVFEIPPMEYTIACRAYFGSWIAMMHESVGKHFCCVGMNPESFEWSEMTYKLLAMSPRGIDADAPNWDKNLLTCYLLWACDSVNTWYRINDTTWSPEHDTARVNLITALCKSTILAGKLGFRKFKGMPSGHVLTALFNTVCNMIMHLIWYLESVPLVMRDVSLYDKCVTTRIYGDDSLDAIRMDMLEYLNRDTMNSVYQRLCTMTITSSLKDGKMVPHDDILDLTFLKRGFRRDGVLYKPVLSLKSLYSMLGHVRKSKYFTLQDQLLSNFRVFSSFAYFYGPDFYNRTTAYFGKLFPCYQFPQYRYYDQLYLHGEFDNMFSLF